MMTGKFLKTSNIFLSLDRSLNQPSHKLSKSLRIGVILFYGLLVAVNAYHAYRIAYINQWSDFSTFLASANALWNGTNPYVTGSHWQYLYPLSLAALLVPFTAFPPIAATFIWFSLSVLSLVFILRMCAFLLGASKRNSYQLALIIGLLFVSIIQSDLIYGQVNIVILAILIGALWFFLRHSVLGSILVALATSLKIMPIVLFPFVARAGIKQTLLWLFTVFLFVIGLPYLFTGSDLFSYYRWWIEHIILLQMSVGDDPSKSFSLAGGIASLLHLSTTPFQLKLFCSLILIPFPLFLMLKKKAIESYFLWLALIPLIGTMSETHHLIFLIPVSMLISFFILTSSYEVIGRNAFFKMIAWILFVFIQIMILWGCYIRQFPVDALGILLLFFTGFFVGVLRPSSTSHLHSAEPEA